MLQGFFDNSGWDGQAPVFVMAGFAATEKQWGNFAEDWQQVLDLQEPRAMIRLKMNEFYKLNRPESEFYGWSERERDDRIIKFVKVINTHVQHGIICSTPIEPYKRLLAQQIDPDASERPFFLAFWSVICSLVQINRDLKIDDKIDLFFDKEGGESKSLMVAQYEKFAALAPANVKPMLPVIPKFEDDVDFKPLQAADMLAWLARRYYFDAARNRDPIQDDSHKFFANLFKPEHDIIDMWPEDRIGQMVSYVLAARAKRDASAG